MYKLLRLYPTGYGRSRRVLGEVFEDPYSVDESGQEVTPVPKDRIRADSIQSPHDTDCNYRKKGDKQVKGYSINVTETCHKREEREKVESEGGEEDAKEEGEESLLNLITNVQEEKATFNDNTFLATSLQATSRMLEGGLEKVHTDGAYHSVDNQAYCAGSHIEFILSGISGDQSRYELYADPSVHELIVIDKQTEGVFLAKKCFSRKDGKVQWRIKTTDKKGKSRLRYFTSKEIQASLLRRKIRQTHVNETNIRNNVEATIFQLGYHFHHNKSKYRGLAKQKMWANSRALWVNFRRIQLFLEQKLNKAASFTQNILFSLLIRLFHTRILT
jgi:hypothetical protein